MGYIMKFYVDADETLINWAMGLEVNKELVKVLQEGLSSYNFKLVIWSMFGKKWAEKNKTTKVIPKSALPQD